MKKQLNLFENCEIKTYQKTEVCPLQYSRRKLSRSQRNQFSIQYKTLDDQIPINHEVRTVWAFVETLDLSLFEKRIVSLEGCVGRSSIDPKILISLWIYAIADGVITASKIAQYCKDNVAYSWICGSVSVKRHVLAKFRSQNADLFESLIVQSVTALVDRNLVSLKEVSQDGVKIKASAAKQSMRRKKTLIGKALELKKHINKLERQCQTHALEKAVEKKKKREIEESKSKMKRIIQAANEINRHKKQLNENRINNGKKKLSNKVVSEIRGSTTDPECRKMRMSDHSVQCAYNFQIAVETDSELVLKTTPIQSSSDTGTMKPMFEDLKRKYPIKISRFLVDSAYIKLGDLNFLHDQNCLVYSPTSKSTALTIKKRVFSGKKNVSEGEKEFIFRMKTNESKQIYNKRIRTSETINAFIRNRRLYQFTVRGLQKVKGFIDLIALTYNMQVIKRMFPNFLTGTS